MKVVANIVNDFQPLTIFTKSAILDVWLGLTFLWDSTFPAIELCKKKNGMLTLFVKYSTEIPRKGFVKIIESFLTVQWYQRSFQKQWHEKSLGTARKVNHKLLF